MTPRHACAVLAAAVALAGCGGDDDDAVPVADPPEPAPAAVTDTEPIEFPAVREALDEAGLDVVETGLGSALADEVSEPALDARRLEIKPSSREFELFVFPTVAIARQGVRDLAETDVVENGGAIARGENVVAVFPERPRGFRGYRVVERVLAGLGEEPAGAVDVQEVPLADVVARPDDFAGEVVTVTGTVTTSLRGGRSDFALVLGDGDAGGRLLVVPFDAQAVDAALAEGDAARVTGQVDVVRTGGDDATPDVVGSASFLEGFDGEAALKATELEAVER